mmetsp:Transcript_8112/g.19304  ORF Transcript_8112/g.19304 Transcript_8112/m.19304 type:complete len:236 (-) Transcript_8112:722-1429(-)
MTGAHGVVPHSLAGLPADAANSVLLTARPRARGAPANDWTICDVLLGHTRDTPLQNLRHCCGPDALSAWSAVHLLARLVEVVINSIVLHSSGVHQCSRRAEKLDLRQVAEAGDVSQSSDHDPNLRHVGLDDTGCAAQGLCGVVMAFNLLARNLQRPQGHPIPDQGRLSLHELARLVLFLLKQWGPASLKLFLGLLGAACVFSLRVGHLDDPRDAVLRGSPPLRKKPLLVSADSLR